LIKTRWPERTNYLATIILPLFKQAGKRVKGRAMHVRSADFIKSAVTPTHYPPPHHPEIAFAGRSNVGKSSLINVLVRRKRLVKTGATPGRTQLINFFNINDQIVFVDLPGYGYARAPSAVRRKWRPMIEAYLSGRDPLCGVIVLLDIRRIPTEKDMALIEYLHHLHLAYQLVLTKCDKLKKGRLLRQQRQIADTLAMPLNQLILFSAKTRQGRETLWHAIEQMTLGQGASETKTESDTHSGE
jgi:GTP-binding protein